MKGFLDLEATLDIQLTELFLDFPTRLVFEAGLLLSPASAFPQPVSTDSPVPTHAVSQT